MHACCQLEVTRHDRETSLIVRDLPSSGNAKVQIGETVLADLTYSGTARYAEITAVQTLSVMHYLVTEVVLALVKSFSYREPYLKPIRERHCQISIVSNHMTSLRLRRNAGTSRSSCSKFAARFVRTPVRIESSETASLACSSVDAIAVPGSSI